MDENLGVKKKWRMVVRNKIRSKLLGVGREELVEWHRPGALVGGRNWSG